VRRYYHEFTKGILRENPIFFIVLGLCPALAVSTSVQNALGMGLAVTFVLVCSNAIISLMRRFIPDKIRIPCFIVVIATFVSIVELLLKAYLPGLDKSLGIFVPLIVVNCIILGRAEAFASKNPVFLSILDGLGMGFGFTLALLLISFIRETLGSGKLAGLSLSHNFEPAMVLSLAPGALLVLGLLIGGLRWVRSLRSSSATS
jgi:electron transport complex protein RnfE